MSPEQTHPSAHATGPEPLRVAIGQFEQLISLGLWAVLTGDRDISVAGVDMAFDELLLLATEPRAPAVVVLDAARVEGRPMRRLHELAPHLGIVALVEPARRRSIPSLLRDGAAKCVPLEARPAEIQAAVHEAARHRPRAKRPSRAPDTRRRHVAAHLKYLTGREREVLELLSDGNTRATIALTLHIKESTVHAHVRSIYRKLGVSQPR